MKRMSLLVLIALLLCLQAPRVRAQSAPSCSYQADGSIICTTSGGSGDSGSGDNNVPPPPAVCTPSPGGTHLTTVYRPEPSLGTNQCSVWEDLVADCTGEIVFGTSRGTAACPQAAQPSQTPCTTFTLSAGGITCTNSDWNVSAQVTFPEIYLDVRPYPATLVRWPTAIRNGGLQYSSGSGAVAYLPYGGGSSHHPQEGDWKDLRLTLTLKPAGRMFVTLPGVGDLFLVNSATPLLIQWEVPSHPAAGGGPLAGSISGLEELPSDLPVFVGDGRAPYLLLWELSYLAYEAVMGCVAGADENGHYDCHQRTGHTDIIGYQWRSYTSSGEIPPTAVKDLPEAVQADLNGDGAPDAYWDHNLTLRRMDDAGDVNNPIYQRSWNWGGTIYWAVREGQGQIGWPGQ